MSQGQFELQTVFCTDVNVDDEAQQEVCGLCLDNKRADHMLGCNTAVLAALCSNVPLVSCTVHHVSDSWYTCFCKEQ